MRLRKLSILVLVFLLPLLAVSAYADTAVLGLTGSTFAVLGGSATTNTGPTTLTGNYGVSPGTSLGLVGVTLNGTAHATDAVAAQAQADLVAAISGLQGLSSLLLGTGGLSGVLTVHPGVYSSGSTFDLNGTLTLDAQGQSDVAFVFLVGSSLTAEVNSTVKLINAGSNVGVYWVETASAFILPGATLVGNFLASTSITLGTGATILCGSALANTANVTMDTNTIGTGCQGSLMITKGGTVVGGGPGGSGTPGPGTTPFATPEPGTFALLLSGLAIGFLTLRKLR